MLMFKELIIKKDHSAVGWLDKKLRHQKQYIVERWKQALWIKSHFVKSEE